MRRLPSAALFALALVAAPAHAQAPAEPPFIELSAEASAEAPNDQASAQAYVEMSGPAPAELATQVNRAIAAALETARAFPSVRVRSAGAQTGPIYGSGRSNSSRAQIEGWRMRSTLQLESEDLPALSTLLGKLQASMAVAEVTLAPSPASRRAAEDAALVEALKNFEARAALATRTLGRKYRIRQLHVGTSGYRPPVPMMRAAMASAESAPAPLQAGESSITVQVNGSVELID